MMPYPPPYAQSKTEENQVLRSLGAILALLGMLLAVLGIIFHQSGVELVFALLIALFSLRAFVLWLGDTRRNQKREPFIPPQSALYNAQTMTMPYPPQPGYVVPQQSQTPFFPAGTNQMTVPFAPAASGVPFVPANSQGSPPAQAPLPPSVRPQPSSSFFSNQTQAMPPAAMLQPMQAPPPAAWTYGPSPYIPGQLVLPAPQEPTPQSAPYAPPPVPPTFPQPVPPTESQLWRQGQQLPQEEGWQR